MKKAVYWIESNYEAMLQTHNAAGIIFALKNMGWKDKQETEHTGDIVINYGHRRRKEEDDA